MDLMVTIRPDAKERLSEALTLIMLVEASEIPEVRAQHLQRLTRLLGMLYDSIEG